MTDPEKICSDCGAAITTDAAEGLCAACLLQQAAWESTPGPTDFVEIEAVQKAFPQLEILERIGRGGMGTVFKARQPKLDRFVALKILSSELAAKPTFAERFAREGKLLARLNHPNIVAVYDFGESGGFYFLLMEYVDGVNLRQAMREEKFTPEQAIGIVPKICDALQYAHDEGVLHRDIKPENILLDTKGRVKIADFGIGRFNTHKEPGVERTRATPGHGDGNLTQTGQILGTPSYMAPEQLDDPNTVDHRADIYSLGVVFYELLTGELPRGRFPLPSEITPVGADVDRIVLKALQKERDKRQQSAEELKTETQNAASRIHSGERENEPPEKPNWELAAGKLKERQSITNRIILLSAVLIATWIGLLSTASACGWFPSEPYPLVIEIGLIVAIIGHVVLIRRHWLKLKNLDANFMQSDHHKNPEPPSMNPTIPPPPKRPRRGCFGCLGLLTIGALVGMLVFVVSLALFPSINVDPNGVRIAGIHGDFLNISPDGIRINPSPRTGTNMIALPLIFVVFLALVVGVVALVFVLVKQAGASNELRTPAMPTKFCTHCGAEQVEGAYACPKCGFATRQKRNYCFNCGVQTDPEQILCVKCGASLAQSPLAAVPGLGGRKDKLVTGLFALLLGWIGVHKFYLESWGWGIVYVLLSWTGIPFIAGVIEGILFLTMDEQTFDQRYNQTQPAPFRW